MKREGQSGGWRVYAFVALLVPSAVVASIGAVFLPPRRLISSDAAVFLLGLFFGILMALQASLWLLVLRLRLVPDGKRFVLVPVEQVKAGHSAPN